MKVLKSALTGRLPVAALVMSGLSVTAGCAPNPQRAATSTLGCAEAVVRQLPDGLTDAEKHCLASGLMVRQCSRFEAWLAGWGKELRDALGSGDASRDDIRADRLGRDCAADASGELLACCRAGLPPGQASPDEGGPLASASGQ